MTVREIRQVGDPVLRTPSDPVRVFDDALTRLIDDMFETMYAAPGVGLAANQIGVSLRLFVYDCGREEVPGPDGPVETGPERVGVVANPRVIMLGGVPAEQAAEPDWIDDGEGCLSVAGLHFPTPRFSTATVLGQDAFGEPVEISGGGLLARCLQHETDHLDGKLYLDRLGGPAKAAARAALCGR